MRENYIRELLKLKNIHNEIVVLDADCSHSTWTSKYAKYYPDSFFNIGIAEQNMIGIAAGLALKNKLPIVNAFSKMLVMRGFEQIHDLIGLQKIRVVLVGHYAGFSAGLEGVTHYSLNDIALMRQIPNINIFTPGNDLEVELCLQEAISSGKASYIRLSKNLTSTIEKTLVDVKNGFSIIKNNVCNKKIILVNVGSVFGRMQKVFEELKKREYPVVFLSIWKLNDNVIDEVCEIIQENDLVVVAEENCSVAGVGEWIQCKSSDRKNNASILKINTALEKGDTGEYNYLMEKLEITSEKIIEKILMEWENV